MTTPIPAEPLYIGGRHVYVKFYALPRNPDEPQMIAGTLTLQPDEAALTLDALVGPRGPQGLPSPIIDPQWGSAITKASDLPTTLQPTDKGKAGLHPRPARTHPRHQPEFRAGAGDRGRPVRNV